VVRLSLHITAWVHRCSRLVRRILSASIRDNILFSHEYNEDFYNLVLDGMFPKLPHVATNAANEACALRQDLDALPQNDLTEVGEKGLFVVQSDGMAFTDIATI
jgi:hypothetical protein